MTTPLHDTPARATFYFNSSAHLLRIGAERATNLREMLAALRSCSDGSIFQHTFRTLEEHHFIRPGYSNDFAHWANADCNETALAERLAGLDVREFTSVCDLRERIVKIVDEYLLLHPGAGERSARQPFYFCSSDTVVLPTPYAAHNLTEFAKGLREVTIHSIHHHFIEARLRLKLQSNDFSVWLAEDMNLPRASAALNRIDIYTSTLEGVRRRIVRIVETAMSSAP